jgi:hypothetical protein
MSQPVILWTDALIFALLAGCWLALVHPTPVAPARRGGWWRRPMLMGAALVLGVSSTSACRRLHYAGADNGQCRNIRSGTDRRYTGSDCFAERTYSRRFVQHVRQGIHRSEMVMQRDYAAPQCARTCARETTRRHRLAQPRCQAQEASLLLALLAACRRGGATAGAWLAAWRSADSAGRADGRPRVVS